MLLPLANVGMCEKEIASIAKTLRRRELPKMFFHGIVCCAHLFDAAIKYDTALVNQDDSTADGSDFLQNVS